MQDGDHSFYYPGTNGKGVLLIHGLTGSPAEMKYLGKQLHKQGFTVYAPTLAGHCRDVSDLLKTTWQDWYGSVEDAYNQFSQQVGEVHAAGICAGGALGLALAAHYPDLASMAVYSMAFRYDGWNIPKLNSLWYPLAPMMPLITRVPAAARIRFTEAHPYGLKDDRLRRQLERAPQSFVPGALPYFPLHALDQMYRLGAQVKRRLPRIKTPTLLLHARDDDMSHPRNSEYIARHIGGPSVLRLLDDSYHMIHVDRERRKVAAMTAQFFGAPEAAYG